MTVKANGLELKTGNLYRTANTKKLPMWQRNRGVVFERLLEPGAVEGFSGDIAVVSLMGENAQFMIPTGLLTRPF